MHFLLYGSNFFTLQLNTGALEEDGKQIQAPKWPGAKGCEGHRVQKLTGSGEIGKEAAAILPEGAGAIGDTKDSKAHGSAY